MLAFACAFTMFAGAAFTDQADISQTEAVDMLTALGVIDGYEDGSFQPDATVTRAEAAKMIYTIRNGGSTDASAFESISTSFTDINGHWAAGYIKYCQTMGIISGKSITSFDPNGSVTGTELAKMMLVTLGYNAERAGLEGTGWDQKTLGLASENNLLNEVTCSLSAACPREFAAQIMYNTIMAPCVILQDGEYTNWNSNDGEYMYTVGSRYMGLLETEVTVNGDSTRYDSLKDGEMQVTYVSGEGEGTTGTTPRAITYSVNNITDMIGLNYKVLWKESTVNTSSAVLDKNDKIYGMSLMNTNSAVYATADDVDTNYDNTDNSSGYYKAKVDGVTYEIVSGANMYTNFLASPTSIDASGEFNSNVAAKNGDVLRMIIDDNGRIAAVYKTTSDLYKVTAVSGSKVSIAGIGSIDTAENDTVVYDGIAKDDVVAVTKLYQSATDDATYIIEKAETVTGKVTGITFVGTPDSSNNKSIVLDDTTYKVYNEDAMKTTLTDDSKAALVSTDLDEEFTLYLVNGYVRAVQQITETAVYAVVNAVDGGTLGSTFSKPQAELVFADGTSKIVTLHEDSIILADSSAHNDGAEQDDVTNANLPKGEIVKYTEMSNGEYKIEEVVTSNYKSNNTTTAMYDADTKTLDGIVTAGDCVLFYTSNSDGDMKATSIRSLDDIDTSSNTVAYVTNSDGKVVAAFINLNAKPSGASDTTVYGIVTSDHTAVTKDGDPHYRYTVATNDGDKTVYVTTESLNKGDLVAFDVSADETYVAGDFTIYTGTSAATGLAVAVTEYNETDKTITYANNLVFNDNSYEVDGKTTKSVDSDVKIVYIDADNDAAGNSGFGITQYDAVTGYANVLLVFENGNPTNKVIAMIVNTNGDTDVMGNTAAVMGAGADASQINAALANGDVSIAGDVDATGEQLNLANNLTVNGLLKINQMPTGTGTLKATEIDASEVSGLTAANITTLFTYADKVTIGALPTTLTGATVGADQTLTVTEDVTDATTLPATMEGTVVLKAVLNTNNLTLDAKSVIVVDVASFDATKLVGAEGAKLTFKSAPGNVGTDDGGANGVFVHFNGTDYTADIAAGNVKTDVQYTYKLDASINDGNTLTDNGAWLATVTA